MASAEFLNTLCALFFGGGEGEASFFCFVFRGGGINWSLELGEIPGLLPLIKPLVCGLPCCCCWLRWLLPGYT